MQNTTTNRIRVFRYIGQGESHDWDRFFKRGKLYVEADNQQHPDFVALRAESGNIKFVPTEYFEQVFNTNQIAAQQLARGFQVSLAIFAFIGITMSVIFDEMWLILSIATIFIYLITKKLFKTC
jgi:hypothetical protein